MWEFVKNWGNVPVGALIGRAVYKDRNYLKEPSEGWYCDTERTRTMCYFQSYDPEERTVTYSFEDRYPVEGEIRNNEGSDTFHIDEEEDHFVYRLVYEPYDPDQENEDDCL